MCGVAGRAAPLPTTHFSAFVFVVSGTSVQGQLVKADDFVATLPEEPVVFVFGSHAHGPVEVDFVSGGGALLSIAG